MGCVVDRHGNLVGFGSSLDVLSDGKSPSEEHRTKHEDRERDSRRGAHVTNNAILPHDINRVSPSAASGAGIFALSETAGAENGNARSWSPHTNDLAGFTSWTAGADTSSPLTAGNEPDSNSPAAATMSVTTDKADYAPGSTATFTVTGLNSGNSVAFQVADLPNAPGVNGIADVYAPFSVTDGGVGDADGLANGIIVANWLVPANGSATGASLQLTATSDGQTAMTTFSDAPNKIVLENAKPGTPESVWAIHGSMANQGDSEIEGFATQISTNAGQTVSFKIDTAASGYTIDIYRLGYYGGDGAQTHYEYAS